MSIANSDLEVLLTAVSWLESGYKVDLVTVLRTFGSSPKPVGSMAVVREDGVIAGSVSGGCIEKQLAESFRDGNRAEVFTHHINDDDARRFGLTCGGTLELLFEAVSDSTELQELATAVQNRKSILRSVDLESSTSSLQETSSRVAAFNYDGRIAVRLFGPAWRLLLIGAGQLSRFTAEFALALDFEVVVCEPRLEFRQGWSVAETLLVDEPTDEAVLNHAQDQQSAVLALTHDTNHDDLALVEAVAGNAFYIGALGSRRNHDRRLKRLEALGAEPAQLSRIHGPIGLDIGSRTSAEIAVSIMAQLIQVRAGRTG